MILGLSSKEDSCGMGKGKAGSGVTSGSGVEMREARSDEIVKCVTCKYFYVLSFHFRSNVKFSPFERECLFCFIFLT